MGAISASKIIYEFLAVCAALRRKFFADFYAANFENEEHIDRDK
jgi:hypothetical protein